MRTLLWVLGDGSLDKGVCEGEDPSLGSQYLCLIKEKSVAARSCNPRAVGTVTDHKSYRPPA